MSDAVVAFAVGMLLGERIICAIFQREDDGHADVWQRYVLANHARELEDADREVAEQRAAMSRYYAEALSQIAVAQEKCECPRCTGLAGKGN